MINVVVSAFPKSDKIMLDVSVSKSTEKMPSVLIRRKCDPRSARGRVHFLAPMYSPNSCKVNAT